MYKQARFEMIAPPPLMENKRVLVVGCGAIGSYAVTQLARLGVRYFELWDPDRVEEVNIGVQAFGFAHIGQRKTEALAAAATDLYDRRPNFILNHKRFSAKSTIHPKTDIVIVGVDNIPARKLVWGKMRKLWATGKRRLYIDGRMGAHTFEVWATEVGRQRKVAPPLVRFRRGEYEKSFHTGVPPAPCGMQATPYTASVCGAVVAATARKFVTYEPFVGYQAWDVNGGNIMKVGGSDAAAGQVGDGSGVAKRRSRAGEKG